MNQVAWTWTTVAMISMVSATAAEAAEPIVISDDLTRLTIGRNLEVCPAADPAIGLDDVERGSLEGCFRDGTSNNNNYGYRTAAVWVRFHTDNVRAEPGPWDLVLDYAPLDRVDFFAPDGLELPPVLVGDERPFEARPIAHRTYVFPVTEAPGRHVYYLRIVTNSPVNLPLSLVSPSVFAADSRWELMLLWLYYGAMLALFLYHLAVWISVRDRMYLYFSSFIGSLSFFQFIHNGLAQQYLWPAAEGASSRAMLVAGYAVAVSSLLFSRRFLVPDPSSRVGKGLSGVAGGILVLAVISVVAHDSPRVFTFGSVATVSVVLLLVMAGILAWRRGFLPARLFVGAWLVLLVSIFVAVLKAGGLVPISFWTTWSYQIASVVLAMMLAWALAARIAHLTGEVARANEELEGTVAARTASLVQAKEREEARSKDLEMFNQQLVLEVADREKAERERKIFEERFVQAQKMEAVGRLAGGLAHDMNNILAVLVGLMDLVKGDLGEDHPNFRDVIEMARAAERAKTLTANMLGFARKGSYVRRVFDLNDVVTDVVALLRPTVARRVTVRTDLSEDLTLVDGDPDQLTHALMNLCINAGDAIGDDNTAGEIVLRTHRLELSATEAARLDVATGVYVRVEVVDDGEGMSDEVRANAVDPFFTTKAVGKGTGLGLSMVYGTARSHEGGLQITSSPGVGTTVALLLPVATEGMVRYATPPQAPLGAAAESNLILVVDDEPIVRRVARRIFERLGFEVREAENGAVALEVLSESPPLFLVVLDMRMPVMDGPTAFYKIRQQSPDVPVLICSGYGSQEAAREVQDAGALGFLGKPYNGESMREIIDRARRWHVRNEAQCQVRS